MKIAMCICGQRMISTWTDGIYYCAGPRHALGAKDYIPVVVVTAEEEQE